MKKLLTLAAGILAAVCLSGQTKVVFAPQWIPQTQFAGFYVAQEKGFFVKEGLDVEFKHPGINSTESAEDMMLKGNAQIITQPLIKSIISRADGKDIVNVMQINQDSGLCCVSHEHVSVFEDLDGKKIGRWKVGFGEICDIIQTHKKIDVEWIPFINGINLYIFGAVDATLAYSFSELVSLELAIGDIPEENIIHFPENGYRSPEDGLWVTGNYYREHKDIVDKFVRASKKGWDYAREHQDEAVAITRKYTEASHVITNDIQQKMMLEEYLRLQVNPETGKADYAPVSKEVYDLNCDALSSTGFITMIPEYESIIK